MVARPAPVFRGQGNQPFDSFRRDNIQKRGQTVPYDLNGAPTGSADPGALVTYIANLPSATTPTTPLWEAEIPAGGIVFTGVGDEISAGVAATGSTVLRIFKNGVQVGTVTFAAGATTGTASFTDSSFVAGDLFGLYPPTVADATLDRVRITLGTD